MRFVLLIYKFISQVVNRIDIKFLSNIQNKLLSSYLAVTIIPLITIGIISYGVSSNAISNEVQKSSYQLIEEISGNIMNYINELNSSTNIFVSKVLNSTLINNLDRKIDYGNRATMDNLSEMNDFLYTTQNSRSDLLSLRLWSDKGDFITCTYNLQKNIYFNYNSLQEAKWSNIIINDNTGSLLMDIHPLSKGGTMAVTASRTAIDPLTHKRIGTILFDLDFNMFKKICSKFEIREGSELFIINSEGNYFYHTQTSQIGKKAEKTLLSTVNGVNRSNNTIIKDIYGRKVILTYVRLDYKSWIIGGIVPVKTLTAQISSQGKITVLICIITMFFAVLLSLFIAKYISKPIVNLKNLMYDVEKGNFDVTINVPESRDEIGHLQRGFNSMIVTINNLIKIRYETELRKKNAELKALIMQINPHFLYNTLEVISAISDEEQVGKIFDITQALGKMLRYSIDLKDEIVMIDDEIENINNYLLIQKIRFEDVLEVCLDIDDSAKKCAITKLTLQPLIENALKHGIERKLGKGTVDISIKRKNESVIIRISDNGIGMSAEKKSELLTSLQNSLELGYNTFSSRSIGLKNVYVRLKIFFGEKMSFDIDSNGINGTSITITIPAISKSDFDTLREINPKENSHG